MKTYLRYKTKKSIAMVLVVAMILTIMPMAVFAEGENTPWTLTAGEEPAEIASAGIFDVTAQFTTAGTVQWKINEDVLGENTETTAEANTEGYYTATKTDVMLQAGDTVTAILTPMDETTEASVQAFGKVAEIEEKSPVDPEAVAQIGEETYKTFDEAVEAAVSGDTIKILKDCETKKGITLENKSITIQGINEEKPTVSFYTLGICAKNSPITIKNCNIRMNVSNQSSQSGTTANLFGNSDLTLDQVNMTILKEEETSNSCHGIYLYQGSNLRIENGSDVLISGFDGADHSGIYADDSEYKDKPCFEIIIDGRSFLKVEDCAFHGMTVNPANVTVTGGSTVELTGNGLNGGRGGLGCYYGKLTIEQESKVLIHDNVGKSWGAFVKDLSVEAGSTLEVCENTGSSGLTVGGTGKIEKDAIVMLNGNAGVGLAIYEEYLPWWAGDLTVEEGAKLKILKNKSGGIRNKNKLTMYDGVVMQNDIENNGGGLLNRKTAMLSDNVQLYNNHAEKAGDDIYNEEGAVIQFGNVGKNWRLDGAPDCDEAINGWYDDSEDARWMAHADSVEDNNMDEIVPGALERLFAVKAAHGEYYAYEVIRNYYVKGTDGTLILAKANVKGDMAFIKKSGQESVKIVVGEAVDAAQYAVYEGRNYTYDASIEGTVAEVTLEKPYVAVINKETGNTVEGAPVYSLVLNYVFTKTATSEGGSDSYDGPYSDDPSTTPETEITEPEVPMAELPTEESEITITEPDVPMAETPEVEEPTGEIEVIQPEIPLGEAPQTGDTAQIAMFVGLLLLAVAGLLFVRRQSR